MKKMLKKLIIFTLVILAFNVSISLANDEIPNIELDDENKESTTIEVNDSVNNEPKEDQNDFENTNKVKVDESIIKSASENKVTISYTYNSTSNIVIATIASSDIQLKDTKPTWSLSSDGKKYVKVFSNNTSYSTPVEDINGRIYNVYIYITQIQNRKANITTDYEYYGSYIVAKIISDIEIKDTKPTWKLSSDRKTYTKVFYNSQKYTTPVEDIHGNKINVSLNIDFGKKANMSIVYQYNEDTNRVTAKILSDLPIKDTKPTWLLSSDKKVYTKEFSSNMTYSTIVEDINGHKFLVSLNITQVRDTKINVQYTHNETTNTVTVFIVSNTKLKNTKSTWTLSNDSKTYTKEFSSNMKYSTPVQDIYGRIIDVEINITQVDDKPPIVSVEYTYNNDNSVTVRLRSNEVMKNTKSTWTLSNNGYIFSKTFSSAQDYTTSVEDRYGNSTIARISFKMNNFTYPQNDNSTIKVKYLYVNNSKVLVEVVSSVKFRDTKPTWNLSSDKYSYSKEFSGNQIYTTPFVDENWNIKNVNIIINRLNNYLTGIDVSAHQGEINWEDVRNEGIDFAILRLGYGQNYTSQDDAQFIRNAQECERLGIPYGVYLYSYALTEEDAKSEAAHALRLLEGRNNLYGTWFDMEDADGYKSRNGMPTNKTLVNICDTFCSILKSSGQRTGIYASLSWLNNQLNSSILDKYDKWVAQWNDTCDYDKTYSMWQYTSKGVVNGIRTLVDMNRLYK